MSKRRRLLGLAILLAEILSGGGIVPAGGGLLGARGAQAAGSPVVGRLTWFGQSCFLLETTTGTRILMDPIAKGIGYPLPAPLKVDAVTISHEHADHNNLGLVSGRPKVLR